MLIDVLASVAGTALCGWSCPVGGINVTANPSAEWTARQMVQAFPEETAPRFLVRDRDQIYGDRFRRMLEVLGVEVRCSPRRG